METRYGCSLMLWVMLCSTCSSGIVMAIETKASNDVGQFLGQLTSLLNQGVLQQRYPEGASGYQSGGYPGAAPPYYPPPGRPYPSPGRPLPPPSRPLPPPGRPYPSPGRPLPPPGRPYPPPYEQYPQGYPGQGLAPSPSSLVGALSSIARYDDLRCVPRLLCEVASGTRPGSYGYPSYSQESPVSFLSKDALVTLLTVLNFVDDSPLLVFGRAALLGYTARGDSRACLVAYPTCPRDPDHLVDYLNNHNGGFFRFFNQQLGQYAPQYQQYQPPPSPYPGPYPPPYPPPYPQRPPRPYPQPGYPHQYSSQNQRYQSRIQTQPESLLEFNYYTSSPQSPTPTESNKLFVSPYRDQAFTQDSTSQKDSKPKLVFPHGDDDLQNYPYQTQSTRGGKSLFFPSEGSTTSDQSSDLQQFRKPTAMVFPDRTGTGHLRLDLDQFGNYKTVYYESSQNRDLRQVAFPREQTTMHFPQ